MKKTLSLLILCLITSLAVFSQTSVKGKIVDENGEVLPGANVVVSGTSIGTTTDINGNFILSNVPDLGKLVISFIGYDDKTLSFKAGVTLGEITLFADATSLEEIIVLGEGLLDIAKDRETPVATSIIRDADIQLKIGNNEFTEILRSTPSVYTTKTGGGYGDGRVNIRGFDQRNTAVMINGQPVNDMENGWVYWSNWSGLQDIASAIQVQRGLGSSKIAISSVGGTINIVTKATDRDEGGIVKFGLGNDAFWKTTLGYSTGLSKGNTGWGLSFLYSHVEGDGYIQGTQFKGDNYFLSVGYKPNDEHKLNFLATGAPQWHNQRTSSFYNVSTISDYLKYGIRYNESFGYYQGKPLSWRQNFYHKPIASINWDWKISDESSLNTILYASWGRGGGTGDIGQMLRYTYYDKKSERWKDVSSYASDDRFRYDETGWVRFDDIARSNSGTPISFGDFTHSNTIDAATGHYIVNDDELGDPADPQGNNTPYYDLKNGIVRRASMNSHNWYGFISNFNHKLTQEITFDVGIDLRTYKGIHYRRLNNLLGADGYRDNDDINNPHNVVYTTYDSKPKFNVFKSPEDEKKIAYYNDGLVRWMGLFGQLEYKKDEISAFFQGSVSRQSYKRVDYFNYAPGNQETGWENILGWNAKGGANWNIDEYHNVFVNAGYYSRQPLFDAVYINFLNNLNPDLENEKILGLELGYGYRSELLDANVNLYRTTWRDRFIDVSTRLDTNGDDIGDTNGTANLYGIHQDHGGIEVDFKLKPTDRLKIFGMLSAGRWEYKRRVSASYVDENQNVIRDVKGNIYTETLYLKGVRVGDAAQFTARLGLDLKISKTLAFDINWDHINKLYAQIDAEDFDDPDHKGSLQLPYYNLFDVGLTYRERLKNGDVIIFRFNGNNIFNERYISESLTNNHAAADDKDTWNGIAKNNRVFFGFGKTWNLSLTYKFYNLKKRVKSLKTKKS